MSNPGRKDLISRRAFLSTLTSFAAAAPFSLWPLRASAFFNTSAFMRKRRGNGQTSNGYTIGQSLRFSAASSKYLSRTQGTVTNSTKWVCSFWTKLSNSSSNYGQFLAAGSSTATGAWFTYYPANGSFVVTDTRGGTDYISLQTNSVKFRDYSAWYHVVLTYDSTQAAASDRVKLFVNNSSIPFDYGSPYALWPSQNLVSLFSSTGQNHVIGCYPGDPSRSLDGYIAEMNFIDGQALDATSFGQTDSQTNQWIPKKYAGTYGTNGFYLPFNDATSTTTLGYDRQVSLTDSSKNNWTLSGFNTYDQVLDSPTNNFCTWSPLTAVYNTSSLGVPTLSNANLTTLSTNTGINNFVLGTHGFLKGKWYWEFTVNQLNATVRGEHYIGIQETPVPALSWPAMTYSYAEAGSKTNYTSKVAYAATWNSVGDVIGVAFDADAGTLEYFKNNSSQAVAYNGIDTSKTYLPSLAVDNDLGWKGTVNFGQGGQTGLTYDSASGGRFKYAPPAGFKALCAANLTAPAIKNPAQYFAVNTRAGNNGNISHNPGFATDLLWIKNRTTATDHILCDSSRLVSGWCTWLNSNTANTEATAAGAVSLPSQGYSISTSDSRVNASANNYVDWYWRKGATPGFDIQLNSHTNGTPSIVNHSLGVKPAMVIRLYRSGGNHTVWHQSLPSENHNLTLNMTNAQYDNGVGNNVFTTSATTITVPAAVATSTAVIYLWAEVLGFSKFGSYTGNGNADGPFVYCGFKPKLVFYKRTDSAEDWIMFDSSRDQYNPVKQYLRPDLANVEGTAGEGGIELLSNGIKFRFAGAAGNTSGGTYVFAAFAESPFKYATAR